MPSTFLSCPICYCEYNNEEYLPRILPGCGHTLCTKCLLILLEKPETSKCPLDNFRFPPQQNTLDAFPINYIAKQVCEEKTPKSTCEVHNEKLRLVCITDKTPVCDECVFHGDHKDHQIKSLKKFESEAADRRKELQVFVRDFEKHQREIQDILSQKKMVLLNLVHDKFQELKWMIVKKELELTHFINSIFNTESGNNMEIIESDPLMMLTKTISNFKEALTDDNNFLIMDQDVSALDSAMSSKLLDEQMQNLDNKFNKITNSLHEHLNSQLESFNKLDFKSWGFVDTQAPTNPEKRSSEERKFHKDLKFELTDDWFVVSIGKAANKKDEHEAEDLSSIVSEISKGGKMCLKIEKLESFAECIHEFGETLGSLSSFTSLKIECNCKEISDRELLQLFSVFVSHIKSLQEFFIDLTACKVGDQSLYPLFTEILPNMGKLKTLAINLNLTNVSDVSIQGFAKKMLPSMKSLENFDFRLYETKVTDKSISQLFTKMEKVRKFILDLGYTAITNESIQKFITITMPTMRSIEEFKLGLTKTGVSDDCIGQVMYNLNHVKQVALYLHGTNITDKSLDTFAKKILPTLQSLEVLELRLGDTKVADQGVMQLLQNLENVRKFTLRLQSTSVTDKMVEAFIKNMYPYMKVLEEFVIDVSDTKVSEKNVVALAKLKEKLYDIP